MKGMSMKGSYSYSDKPMKTNSMSTRKKRDRSSINMNMVAKGRDRVVKQLLKRRGMS